MDSLDLFQKVINFLIDGNLVSSIIKFVLLAGGGLIVWRVFSWANDRLKAIAYKKTQEQRILDQSNIEQKNKDVFNDASKSEAAVEDALNKK